MFGAGALKREAGSSGAGGRKPLGGRRRGHAASGAAAASTQHSFIFKKKNIKCLYILFFQSGTIRRQAVYVLAR